MTAAGPRLVSLPAEGEAPGPLQRLEAELARPVEGRGLDALVLELDGDPALGEAGEEPSQVVERARRVQRLLEGLRAPGRVAVAAVSGRLEGAGCALAWACRVVVAAEGAWLLPRELEHGRLSGSGALQRLARRAGEDRAAALLLVGEPLSAQAAAEAGLVDLVVPAGEHRRAALSIAERCLARGRAVTDSVLELLDGGAGLELDDALELEVQHAGLVAARRAGS